MGKIDLKKIHKHLYKPSAKKIEIVDVPEFKFIMIDGAIEKGKEPGNSPLFAKALEALYGISYTLKFMSKLYKKNPIDYTVMTLEGLWWIEEGEEFNINVKDNWHWTLMIMQPNHITKDMFKTALKKLKEKKDNTLIDELRLEKFREGLSVQTLHIGPYSEEPKTVESMEEFANTQGYKMLPIHHEIYLNDPRKTSPEKLRTILRHNVKK